MNPDGVAAGHWRHNVKGVDVNRDWGPFTQPESQSVINWLQAQEAGGRELKLMLDFHSTREDLFYTQPITDDPPDFASRWLGASAARLPDFPFKHEAGPVTEQANAKNYFHSSRAIPAITYESGDETDREALKIAAAIFAEEMMREMLKDQPSQSPGNKN
jgi:predicted deacylase